ncbi:hypothetical protein [Billgrantia montanilacus]|uniref:Uncharacterized protein n=1 Tax=Billgrantia montanilacus TaxID=2282305 RepID=A0A368U0Z8_9GAMM|nr:hypothetical protein [Halomonas montanilacus]RCV90491.1 hypothetical protein DU505_06025 [Halomonas montanilacus]
MIENIEEALAAMGCKMGETEITERARKAVADGDTLELVVRVTPTERAGAVVTMHSMLTSAKESHGRLIRLD